MIQMQWIVIRLKKTPLTQSLRHCELARIFFILPGSLLKYALLKLEFAFVVFLSTSTKSLGSSRGVPWGRLIEESPQSSAWVFCSYFLTWSARFPGFHGIMSLCSVLTAFFLSVSYLEDEPHVEVGGSVEGARLSGTHCLLRCQRGKRSLAQVLPLCMCALQSTHDLQRLLCFLVFWLSEYSLHSMQWLLTRATPPSYLRKVPYSRSTRSVLFIWIENYIDTLDLH